MYDPIPYLEVVMYADVRGMTLGLLWLNNIEAGSIGWYVKIKGKRFSKSRLWGKYILETDCNLGSLIAYLTQHHCVMGQLTPFSKGDNIAYWLLKLEIMRFHYHWFWPVYLYFAKFCIFSRKLHDIFCIVCTFMLHNLHCTYIPH